MPTIENIPQNMIDEHVAWHTRPGRPALGGRRIDPWPPTGGGPTQGSGEEFLVWHEGYVERFRTWAEDGPANERPAADRIAPWLDIPQGLKMGMVGWNAQRAADAQRLGNMSNFASLDELGRFLEWGLHGWLHQAAFGMWSEPVILSFESPGSTYFWQLHGLIDHWRQLWVDADQNDQPAGPNFLALPSNGTVVEAAIGVPGEIDRFQFLLPAPGNVRIEARGTSDVVIYLAGPNSPTTLIAWDDDSGEGRNSRIDRLLSAGSYFIYVTHYSRERVGDYGISVREA